MRNSNRTKLLLASVLGLLIISIVPAISANGTVKRSLDDWFYEWDGIHGLNYNLGSWWSDTLSEPLGLFPHYDSAWNLYPVNECDYKGFIHDRDMGDGIHMITVHIRAKDVPLFVMTAEGILIFSGLMDYLYQFRFKVDVIVWSQGLVDVGIHPTGFTDDGNIILPPAWVAFDPFPGPMFYNFEFVSILFIGGGKGEALAPWNGLETGDSAKVRIGQYGVLDKDFDPSNPFDPNNPHKEWLIDFIKVY